MQLFFIENKIYVIRKNKKCGDNSNFKGSKLVLLT